MSQASLRTLLRHPLASKRSMIQFSDPSGEVSNSEVFELLSRYEAHSAIAQGTYGFVCAARDNNLVEEFRNQENPPEPEEGLSAEQQYDESTLVAVKKLAKVFEGHPRLWLCAAREIQLMMSFSHPNVISCKDFFIPLGGMEAINRDSIKQLRQSFNSVYIVMKKMDYTLREVMDTYTIPGADGNPMCCPTSRLMLHPVGKDYRQYILYQILSGVGYLHRCSVIHRDLKPENVILDRNFTTCVTDFGQGRKVGEVESFETVLDTCTQWYAAPETLTIFSTNESFSRTGFIDNASMHSMDVWSIGCIAAEMLIGRPLFYRPMPGGGQQLAAILDVLGSPTEQDIQSIAELRDERTRESFKREIAMRLKKYTVGSRLASLLRSPLEDEEVDADEVKMIESCLQWDPRKRITIAEALASPFFTSAGYEPPQNLDEGVKGPIQSVKAQDILDPQSGRQFLWNLFVQRHPEVDQLCERLEV